ncbi:Glycosyltransferase involved in cell wall bisynthesis [Marinomonas polaris DSM 16579]|uniref:Glycosyltransferase involved in cell wall bisynthesis n=1 Tax=Marinomonas polaris DSM 16579 TaxID=1122206 RepID=A0A1M5MDQ9_9GAMM|nr:glycosyltransferase [Marinomonas polaris]SHG75049.1 Glycosyltransferase involved in cell wall bisynthesis [Marinomonas polaris DSM 16579]
MNSILLCDHYLDPRLVRRKKWLDGFFGSCDVYVDKTRGEHFKNDGMMEKDINEIKIKHILKSDLIYISGVRVLISHFTYFLIARLLNKNMVYEIPDLPLRSKSKVKNYIISFIFKFLVFLLFKRVVITSSAFVHKLPKKIDFYECENLPSEVDSYNKVKSKKLKTIAFVGVLRYLKQMEFLIKYASMRQVCVDFYGGPDDAIEELKKYNDGLNIHAPIRFFGKFKSSDIKFIYDDIAFVYSVYDVEQENVRLALPNKLYESILFKTPIIVSKKTHLSNMVEKEKCGFSVDSQNFNDFCIDMDIGLADTYQFDSGVLEDKILNQEIRFIDWIKKSLLF